MIKRILSAVILFASVAAFGQGACSPDKLVLLDTGRPANGATIRICPAGGTFPGCGSSLFTDPTLATPLPGSPVVTSDTHGNWGFCAAAGQLYDYQVSCTGCTTFTVKNFPLTPASPIAAASLTSSTANPANVGVIKLASIDCADWRNNANTGNIQLCKTSSDQLDATAFPGVLVQALISSAANPAQSGLVRVPNNVAGITARNSANTGDFDVIKLGTDNLTHLTGGGGDVVVPAASDTVALLNATQSLPNKTLPSPTSTGTDSGTEVIANKTAQHPTITTGIAQGSGLKHQRVAGCTTAATVNAVCGPVTLTWTSAFADTSYTLNCFATGTVNTGFITISTKAAGSVTLFGISSAATAWTVGSFECIAIHD
jgi:hypothetical protein